MPCSMVIWGEVEEPLSWTTWAAVVTLADESVAELPIAPSTAGGGVATSAAAASRAAAEAGLDPSPVDDVAQPQGQAGLAVRQDVARRRREPERGVDVAGQLVARVVVEGVRLRRGARADVGQLGPGAQAPPGQEVVGDE